MSDLEIFGSLVVGTQVTDAVLLTLQTWMPTYTERMNRLLSKPTGWLPTPASYVVSNDPNHWPEDQPPAVVVSSPGTIGAPKRTARDYRAMWDVRVTVFVAGRDRASTDDLAKYHGAVVREILAQKASLDGFAAGNEWHGESYSVRVAERDQRTLGSCSNRFAVDVRDVVQALGGPTSPLTDPSVPPADWYVANTVTATITPE